jgi:hypothetical protein
MTAQQIQEIMELVVEYGDECCSNNEYDNRYAMELALQKVQDALRNIP